MTDTAWKPTGRDAMTRDGRRVRDLRQGPNGWDGLLPDGVNVEWFSDGRHRCSDEPCPLDLVADCPDADPLPDADGWRKHTPRPVDPEAIVEVRLRSGKVLEGANAKRAIEWDWNESGGSATITHYRIVRPAPSGPVVEETVKRIVPIGSDEWADQAERLEWAYIAGIMRELAGRAGAAAELPSYIQYAIDIAEARATEGWRTFRARQIGEAIEGK